MNFMIGFNCRVGCRDKYNSYHSLKTVQGQGLMPSYLMFNKITNSLNSSGRMSTPIEQARCHQQVLFLLSKQLWVTGNNLNAAHMFLYIIELEHCILQDEGPHIVAEPIRVKMSLQSTSSSKWFILWSSENSLLCKLRESKESTIWV